MKYSNIDFVIQSLCLSYNEEYFSFFHKTININKLFKNPSKDFCTHLKRKQTNTLELEEILKNLPQ